MALTRRLVKGQAITSAEHDANIDHFEQNPNGIYLPQTAGTGIQLYTTTPGDGDFGWRDMEGELSWNDGDANTPSFQPWQGTIKQPQFAVNDVAQINFHMKHDYVPNSEIRVHVHWSHTSATYASGAPTFTFDGTYAKGFDQAAFGTPVSVNISENGSAVRYQHMTTEVPLSAPLGAGGLIIQEDLEVDGLIFGSITLTSNTMIDGVAAPILPFIHYVDIHYQSTNMATIGRAPNFYVPTP